MTTEATDRAALREKIELEIYRIGRRSWNGTTLSERVNKIMALIDTIAPDAQPLLMRSQLDELFADGLPKSSFFYGGGSPFVDRMIAAGYAREDELEPQVGEVEPELEPGAGQDVVDAIERRDYLGAFKALAKAVAERGDDAP